MKNWKTYQLSKQLVYFPGEVFCEVFRGGVPVGPKYPYSMEHSSPPRPTNNYSHLGLTVIRNQF